MKIKITIILIISICGVYTSFSHSNNVQVMDKEKTWVSIGRDAADFINKERSLLLKLNMTQLIEFQNKQIVVIEVNKSDINLIGQLMHDKFRRCPGFIQHETLTEAKNIFRSSQPSKAINYTIDNQLVVSDMLSKVTPSNMVLTVEALSSFTNRYYNAQSGTDAAVWLKEDWSRISADREDVEVELFLHPEWKQASVIATILGSTNPDEVVVIGGHLDSINWQTNQTEGRAPGVDDNASGIAILSETLNTIVLSGYRPQRTIKLIGYAAEEVGLLGSKAIAKNFKDNSINVVGVAQFDMSGFQGTDSADIVFITDYTNSAQTNFMAKLLDTYIPNVTYDFDECGYACSDHAAWNNKGFAASFPFESKLIDYNNTIHTSNDVNFDVEHATNFLNLSILYVAELAKGGLGTDVKPLDPVNLERTSGGGISFAALIIFIGLCFCKNRAQFNTN